MQSSLHQLDSGNRGEEVDRFGNSLKGGNKLGGPCTRRVAVYIGLNYHVTNIRIYLLRQRVGSQSCNL